MSAQKKQVEIISKITMVIIPRDQVTISPSLPRIVLNYTCCLHSSRSSDDKIDDLLCWLLSYFLPIAPNHYSKLNCLILELETV